MRVLILGFAIFFLREQVFGQLNEKIIYETPGTKTPDGLLEQIWAQSSELQRPDGAIDYIIKMQQNSAVFVLRSKGQIGMLADPDGGFTLWSDAPIRSDLVDERTADEVDSEFSHSHSADSRVSHHVDDGTLPSHMTDSPLPVFFTSEKLYGRWRTRVDPGKFSYLVASFEKIVRGLAPPAVSRGFVLEKIETSCVAAGG